MLGRRRARARAREAGTDLGYLFIVTYGRSGSTLLMGLLNGIPGYLLRGESLDAVHHLWKFHSTLAAKAATGHHRARRKPTHPFFGISDFPVQTSIAGIRRLVLDTLLRPEPGTRVTGFKEIRWYHADLEEYVAWLREVFPGARFVVNTRDNAAVLQSKWWATGDKAAELAGIEKRLLALAADLGDAAYHVHYDDYVADPMVLRGLYDWLGEPFDEQQVRATMAVRHSV